MVILSLSLSLLWNQLQATVPVGGSAVAAIPTLGLSASGIKITESGNAVWASGQFIPGTKGVVSGRANDQSINFGISSGSYVFSLN